MSHPSKPSTAQLQSEWEAPLVSMDFAALPPELMDVPDTQLLLRSLTHRSFFDSDPLRNPDRLENDLRSSKVLELEGDAVLFLVATRLLVERYPRLEPGALTTIRGILISNVTLSYLARHYQLDHHLKVGDDARRIGTHQRQSVLADAFESRIGAIYVDAWRRKDMARLVELHDWVGRLFAPEVLPEMDDFALALERRAREPTRVPQPKRKRQRVLEGEAAHQGRFAT